MRQIVIGITGQKRSGKDSIASEIIRQNPYFISYAFADPVRQATTAFFGWTSDVYNDIELKERIDPFWGISPRQAMQFMGTEVGRIGIADKYPEFAEKTGDQIWIKRFKKILYELKQPLGMIVTDVRFLNELESIRSLDKDKYLTHIIGVTRKGCGGDGHASEQEVTKCVSLADTVLENNYGFESIENFVSNVLEYIEDEQMRSESEND